MNVRKSFTALALLFLGWSAAHAEQYTIPLFLAPGTSGDPQGVLRLVNDTGDAATVQVFAIADDGTRAGPATIALGASAAAEFDATELRSANAAKGLSGGLGSFSSDVRLLVDSDAPIVPLAFVRVSDGTLSAMHDAVRAASTETGQYSYEVPIFNLSTVVAQASRLRLINPGDAPAAVTIAGRDDGASAGTGTVQLSLPAGGARTLTAQQLEAGGTGLAGRLGAGIGRWRLTVTSDRLLSVVNVVASSTGHWNNLSTTAVRGAAPADLAGFNDRFVGQSAILETEGGRSSFAIMANGRFSETVQTDGMFATGEGGYEYVGLGPDAGRLTLDYDDGEQCRSNLYFSSRTGGWFATRCTGGAGPVDTWSGGNWFVEGEEDDGGGDGGSNQTTYGVNDALPGVPTSGVFVPARTSGASVRASGGSTMIDMNDGGHIELNDGARYTCTSSGGCTIVNGTVTRGMIEGGTAGGGTGPGAGAIQRLTDHDAIDLYPSWSPDGQRIAFHSYRDGNSEVYVMDADGGNPQRLTDHDAGDEFPSWSPDGRRIAFESNRDGNWEVYVMDADGGNPQRLTDHDAGDEFPSWSPDGRRIAFESNRDGNPKVYVMDADGGNPQRLTDHDASDGDPSWSPDGRRIAFDSNRDGNWEVYVMDADGGNPQRLTDHSAADAFPSWSPDGRRIAFNSNRDGNWEVYVMDADGGNPQRLTDHDATDTLPSWSPDGRRIAFNSNRDGNWEVYVMDAGGDGTGQDPLPRFGDGSGPGDLTFTAGTTISPLGLPGAGGGDGPRTYSLSPEVPGLIFDATAHVRELTGTPTSAGTYNMTYRVRDTDGDTDSLTFTITVTEPASEPDLAVESASVSDGSPSAGASFTLRATVRNRGDARSAATTLRYYRSTNATISRSDTQVGTDSVSGLAASGTSAESISLTAPSSTGTYYYGACVDSVAGESDTDNNCSSGVRVTVADDPSGGRGRSLQGRVGCKSRRKLHLQGLNLQSQQLWAGIDFVFQCGHFYRRQRHHDQRRALELPRLQEQWQQQLDDSCCGLSVVLAAWQRALGLLYRGTKRQGGRCGYNPTASGEYRPVADMTIGGRRGNSSSENTVVVN